MKHYLILILTLLLIPKKGISQVFLPTECDWVREEKEDSVYIFIENCCAVFSFLDNETYYFKCEGLMNQSILKDTRYDIFYKYNIKNKNGIYKDKEHSSPNIGFFCEIKGGKPDGKWAKYFESGNVWQKGRYRKGKLSGKFVAYDLEGHIEVKRYYTNGLLNGYDYAYSYKEKMMSKQFYIMGRAITEVKVKPYKIK